MVRGKLILIFVFCGILLQANSAQNKEKENNMANLKVDSIIRQLKLNPVSNYHAAHWFVRLSLSEKKEYSEKLGVLVLNYGDYEEFVLAFGSDRSPYPWAFHISKNTIKLHTNNKFVYILRNDKYVQNQWGVHWTSEPYTTRINTGSPIFIKNKYVRDRFCSVWVPVSAWQYVGPVLERSKDILGGDENAINGCEE